MFVQSVGADFDNCEIYMGGIRNEKNYVEQWCKTSTE